MSRLDVSLDDKFTESQGPIFLTGIQALVRLLLVQARRDALAGLETAGFVSGYRGSPLAGLDRQLWAARAHLEPRRIEFLPAVNEELGATAVWGSQQVNAFRGARVAGVFGLWYGKAPGVDRAGDALKHANAAGSSRNGGVLAVCGDDHACKSSTMPSQSELALLDAGIPVLNPADVQEVLDFGLHGWALSRFSGLWTGLIALADTMDSAASVEADLDRVRIVLPELELPPGGLNFRPGVAPLAQEELLHAHKLPAALAYARANRLDRVVLDAPDARLGIVTTGKAHLDVLQALADLGIGEAEAREAGIRLYKVGMSWPLEPQGVLSFAEGLEQILVVEEKRGLVEGQLKEHLHDARRHGPRVLGKRDEQGAWLLAPTADLSPGRIARAIAARLPRRPHSARLDERLAQLEARERVLGELDAGPVRLPFYCAGCPHNRSTALPEGSRGLAGIGCHYMVQWMDRNTDTVSQMGGEGVQWLGQAPFTDEAHVFANLGDGTYYHSGTLAIRAAVAAGRNITFKLLYNDAVAMTGGQSVDGPLTVPQITRQLAAEGVQRIAVLSDDPSRYGAHADFAPGVTVQPRQALDAVHRELRETPGCTVLVYDQTCAAELRRRRKRGLAPDPELRLFIHPEVCEGCGDCSVQSNCAAVEPLETELGRKRRINQSACNKDYSCAEGLCPAFVEVRGGSLRRERSALDPAALERLPEPTPFAGALEEPWNVLVTGIGGTGVVTIGALLGMAAHLDGKAATLLDMTGLAQKGGAVTSHVRLAASRESLHVPRIPVGQTDLLLACDPVVAAGPEALARLEPRRSAGLVNPHVAPTAEFVLDNEVRYDAEALQTRIAAQCRTSSSVPATELARRVLGDEIAANLLMVGYAFQQGLIPLSEAALLGAIELNGTAVEMNRQAFQLGRLAAHDPKALPAAPAPAASETTLDELIERRAARLRAYQDEALAQRYRGLVARVRGAERSVGAASEALGCAVAEGYHKLLAYKDEYEVARLYSDPEFARQLAQQFEGGFRVAPLLAPPLWAKRDRETGRPRKRRYGRWIFTAMRWLARLRFLRGTPFDPFGYSADRRLERRLIADYEHTVCRLLDGLAPENHALAVEIAALPQQIRGFDQVKRSSAEQAGARQVALLERYEKLEPVRAVELPLLPLVRRKEADQD